LLARSSANFAKLGSKSDQTKPKRPELLGVFLQAVECFGSLWTKAGKNHVGVLIDPKLLIDVSDVFPHGEAQFAADAVVAKNVAGGVRPGKLLNMVQQIIPLPEKLVFGKRRLDSGIHSFALVREFYVPVEHPCGRIGRLTASVHVQIKQIVFDAGNEAYASAHGGVKPDP
jgi:hypothetical protein